MNNKVKLGIFVLIGLTSIVVSILAVGSFSMGKKYKVYVLFDNASGLTKKAKVKIAGVDIGVLQKVDLQETQARLCLVIDDNIALYQNATASIVSMGIIGTKYIEVHPGNSSLPKIKDGDSIAKSQAASIEESLGKIVDKINTALDSISKDGKNGDMIDNLASSIRDLKSVIHNIAEQNAKITSVIENINKFSIDLADITAQNKHDIRDAVVSIKEVADKLDRIMTKINEGEGTLAKLLNDEEMGGELKETVATAKEAVASAKDAIDGLKETLGGANKLQLKWDYLGRYNFRSEEFINDIGVNISLRKERFYYVGISNVGDRDEEEDREERKKINTITALLGFRGEHAEIYGGVMRNKGGFGAGYSFFDPVYAPYRRLYVHLNAYNFGREDNPPEVDAGVRFGITRWLYVGVAVEDIAYKTALAPYIKLEITDNDISRLLGIASIAAVASQ